MELIGAYCGNWVRLKLTRILLDLANSLRYFVGSGKQCCPKALKNRSHVNMYFVQSWISLEKVLFKVFK